MQSDELTALASLALLTLIVITLVIVLGIKLSRSVQTRYPQSHLTTTITPLGIVVYACLTALFVLGATARAHHPESSLGQFLNRSDGLAAAIAATIFLVAFVGEVFEKMGFPIIRRPPNDDQAGR